MLSSRSLKPLVLGLAAIAAANLAGCDRQSATNTQPAASSEPAATTAEPAGLPAKGPDRSHKGSALPALTVSDPSAQKLALASLKGKPVLINLWATWCAPCVKELPTLDALALKGVRVLTISQDSGDPDKVGQFLADQGVKKLEPWLDPENELSFHYATGTLPTSVLYDSLGREVWRYVGENDWATPASAALIAEAR